MGCRHVATVPCGNPNRETHWGGQSVRRALYHGNLSVPENDAAARDLIANVFAGLDCELVVAGHAPSAALRKLAGRYDNVSLVADPSDNEMWRLVEESSVNILTTRQTTGLKIKLLNALFRGRHCLVNSEMVEGTGLKELCVVEDDAAGMQKAVMRLMKEDFGEEQMNFRRERLNPYVTSNAIGPILEWLH